MSKTALNSSMISASTLAIIVDLPPSKVNKYLPLLVDEDLFSYRGTVESKVHSLENFIAQSKEETEEGKDLKSIGSSTQSELLACYSLMKKIDTLIEKRERDADRAANKGNHKKSVVDQVNKALLGGSGHNNPYKS